MPITPPALYGSFENYNFSTHFGQSAGLGQPAEQAAADTLVPISDLGPRSRPPLSDGSLAEDQDPLRPALPRAENNKPKPYDAFLYEDKEGKLHMDFRLTQRGTSGGSAPAAGHADFALRLNVHRLEQFDVEMHCDPGFLQEYVHYPKAFCKREEYTGRRWKFETEYNHLVWAITWINPELQGPRKDIREKVVNAYRTLLRLPRRYKEPKPSRRDRRAPRQQLSPRAPVVGTEDRWIVRNEAVSPLESPADLSSRSSLVSTDFGGSTSFAGGSSDIFGSTIGSMQQLSLFSPLPPAAPNVFTASPSSSSLASLSTAVHSPGAGSPSIGFGFDMQYHAGRSQLPQPGYYNPSSGHYLQEPLPLVQRDGESLRTLNDFELAMVAVELLRQFGSPLGM